MPPRLLSVIQDLRQIAPQTAIELRLLPSGVAFLNVYPGHREFVLEYSPSGSVGVSENRADTPPFDIGHDHVFDTVEPAAEQLLALVRASLITPQSHAA
jgi:hypothetical protein